MTFRVTSRYRLKNGIWEANGRTPVVGSELVLPRVRVSRIKAETAPWVDPGARWSEENLNDTVWVRPRESDDPTKYVDWETLVGPTVAAAQAAAPSTPWVGTKAFWDSVTGNRILSFPKGIFRFAQFNGSGYTTGNGPTSIGIGQGYSNGARGIVGAGSQSTPGPGGAVTEITATATTTTGTGGQILYFNGKADAYLGGVHLTSQQVRGDNVFHGGATFRNCSKPIVEYCSTKGFGPGRSNIPPDETFGINFLGSADATLYRCSADGRDKNNVRTCASPWGWNNVTNTPGKVLVQECYAHHGLTSMLTFWQTHNIKTVDYIQYSWALGARDAFSVSGEEDKRYRGSGINHEQCGGSLIEHIRPTLMLCSENSSAPTEDRTFNRGGGMSYSSNISDIGAITTVTDPLWDTNYNASNGMFFISWNVGALYNGADCWDSMRTHPKVILGNGVQLIGSMQKTVRGGGNVPGWQTKDPARFMALSTG